MGGSQAAKTLLQIQVASMKAQNKTVSPEEEAELLSRITERYNQQMTTVYAASRLWVDAIINPMDTRTWIATGIAVANHAPITKPYNVGVIQT
jgi:acetyl-CoA carboxylase carboxyltransferase component